MNTVPLQRFALLGAITIGAGLSPVWSTPATAFAQDGSSPFVPTTSAATPPATAPPNDAMPSVDTVMNQMDDLYRSTSSRSEMSMEINTENWSRTLEMESWSQGEDTALIVIRSPAREAGTATLKTDEGLWNYAPRADRLMRIPSGMMSDGWMGSHFTNDDLVRESSWQDDYETTLAWGEHDGDRVLLTTSVTRPDAAVVYTRIVMTMQDQTWLPMRADYYDDDDVVRTMTWTNIREFDGRQVPSVMTIVPTDHPNEFTRVTYDDLEFNITIDNDLFTQRGLRRAAQTR
ncbi:MAG: hypothetical protein ACJA1R_000955 [Flavobacteriales bacterium]|jgi:hypothetical protein